MSNKQKPIYMQIKEDLCQAITNKSGMPGERMCSEEELAKKYQVSRMTARHALSELEREGVVERFRGMGTFLAENKIHRNLNKLTTFRETLIEKGLVAESRLLSFSIQSADTTLTKLLSVLPKELIIRTQRLYFANQSPMAVLDLYIIREFCPELTATAIEQSYPDYLEQEYGIIIKNVDITIDVIMANKEQAQLLEVKRGFPLLRFRRFDYDGEGCLISYYLLTYLLTYLLAQ